MLGGSSYDQRELLALYNYISYLERSLMNETIKQQPLFYLLKWR